MKPRVIPVLYLRNRKVINTLKFKGGRYIGDPINTARLYNDLDVDELVVIDGDAGKPGNKPDIALIDKIRQQCFFPVTYGGGIRSLNCARDVLRCGVEKVVVNQAATDVPSEIAKISEHYGSQSLCISVDVKYNWLKRYQVYQHWNGKGSKTAVDKHISSIVRNLNPGEIMATAVHRDGTKLGYDLNLIGLIKPHSGNIPLVINGGANDLLNIREGIKCGAHAAAGTSLFVTKGDGILINYPDQASLLKLFGE